MWFPAAAGPHSGAQHRYLVVASRFRRNSGAQHRYLVVASRFRRNSGAQHRYLAVASRFGEIAARSTVIWSWRAVLAK
jgi:hypothetical protein